VDNDTQDFEEDDLENSWRKGDLSQKDSFHVTLEGYEGPLDLLLSLAQEQKVDLAHISIVILVDQYVDFIEESKKLELVVAADYLVMASWLAFLKSKLLLPQEDEETEHSGEILAEALKFQLKRLEAIRSCGESLFKLPQKNKDFFGRGNPEGWVVSRRSIFETNLYDLLTAYGDMNRRKEFATYTPKTFYLLSMDEALERLENMLGKIIPQSWAKFKDFITSEPGHDELYNRSEISSTFIASLEIAKQGRIHLKQDTPFGELLLRLNDKDN
jgi:segregation and condensation protein A